MLYYLTVLVLLLAPQASGGPYDLAFKEVRDGVWMVTRPDPFRSPVFGNVTIILTDEDVVVVDAGSSPRAGRHIIAKIRALTDLPVTTLINTHGHEDHVLGNQAFVDAYPDIQIIARTGTRDYLESGRVESRVRAFSRNLSATQRAGEAEAARVARRGLNGDPTVAEHLLRYYDQDIYAVRNEYRDVRITPPRRVFEGRMVLERPGRTIELLDLGFGKAGSDVAVLLPEERLLIAGDIVTYPIPLGFARLQTEWLKSLRRLVELDFDDIVPGHGLVLVDKAYVRRIIEMVEFELEAVRESVRSGRDADTAAWDITFAGWAERFVGRDPIGLYYFNEWFVKPAVERAHAELSGSNGQS
ncbi:MAG: MBL fold metallo-hydrolase [Acidobacteriota bacterium]